MAKAPDHKAIMLCDNLMTRNLHYLRLALTFWAVFFPAAGGAKEAQAFKSLASGETVTLGSFGGKPALAAFWRSDCAPCQAEKPALMEIAATHPNVSVVIISLQDEILTRKAFASVPNNMHVLLAQDAEKTLRALGDENSAMPYSVFLRADSTQCMRRKGLLGTRMVDDWVRQC
jgi:thiol-disulfide isomerase/thioredoxin